MSAVRFVDVHKSFGELKVLRGVSLELPDGATTAVVGESGSGKTSLLQLVNAVLRPDVGEVLVFGEPIPSDDLVAHRRRIGYSVQGAGLFPHLTNHDNVTLVAQLEGWDRDAIAARYSSLLEQMELPADVSERYPAELSGGQQQRVGLARALMLKPRLLLLDEPFSAVDPITRVGLYERFVEVKQAEGVSALLVTHDMREAVRLADRLVILKSGEILQAGPTQAVLAEPEGSYVKALLREQLS